MNLKSYQTVRTKLIVPQLQDIVTLAREWIGNKFPDWKLPDYELKKFDPSFDLSPDENVLFVSGNIAMDDVPYARLGKIIEQVNAISDCHVFQRMEGTLPAEKMDINISLRLVYFEPGEIILTQDEACKVAPKAFEEFC